MEAKAKKTEINVLNIFLCLLVMLIHCMGNAVSQTDPELGSYAVSAAIFRLSSFAVQGFIFLSAVKLFMKKDGAPYGQFMLRRITSVFLPYIFYVLVYYLIRLFSKNEEFDILYFIRSVFIGDMHAHFYFVVLIMQFYLLFPLFKKLYDKENAAAVTALSFCVSLAFQFAFPHALNLLFGIDFIYTDRIFLTYFAYWTLGAFAGINYEAFKAALFKIKYPVFICFLIFAAILCPENYRVMRFSEYIPGFGELFFAYTFPAILTFFILANLISDLRIFKSGFFSLMNKVSYRVYLIHPIVLCLFDKLFGEILKDNPAALNIIRYLAVVIISFAVSMLIEKLKEVVIYLTKKLTA